MARPANATTPTRQSERLPFIFNAMKKFLFFSALVLLSGGIFGFYRWKETNAIHEKSPVYIIGIDGASWNLIDPLFRKGKLPHLRQLVESGTSGPLASAKPAHSAFLWTSIATGKVKEKHGIGDFVVKTEEEEVTPATGNLRRVKAFWNMLSEKGLSVSVVNWWITWPTEEINGVMISDRYRLGQYRKRRMQIAYPASLQDKIPFPVIDKEKAYREWKQYRLPELYDVTNDGRITAFDKALRAYPNYWCQDAAVWDAAKYVLKHHPTDVFAVIFRIVDISSHFMWCYIPFDLLDEIRDKAKSGTLTEADLRKIDQKFAEIMEPVYSYADMMLGEIMKAAPRNATFIVTSDHGFGFHKTSYTHTTQDVPPPGIIVLSGPAYRKGAKIEGATLYDVTPTLLYQLNLPVANDFDGKVLFDAFQSRFRRSYQIAHIATWETKRRPTDQKPIRSEDDKETLEELKSLGYLQ